ncbi:hypothetical protein G5T42_09095 [Microbacterium sp. 4R-513]|uniref:hypothetical protein n=1 Tax=Microbacterium sp. 4R-513 TaxID=2567934 RepID=UPI0013E0FE6A|nr:hypothetical protein [Microbacterium sp. 4R-513]QIG39622.1 hypothetical protein G5T42_09095 [Microbacterium sp. 4R-513]
MPGTFDLDTTTLAQLLDDPRARAVIVEVVPELPNHPMIGFVKNLPVNQLLQMAGSQLDPATVSTLTQRIQAL